MAMFIQHPQKSSTKKRLLLLAAPLFVCIPSLCQPCTAVNPQVWGKLAREAKARIGEAIFKQGALIQFVHRDSGQLRYGKVNEVLRDGKAYVQIADGTFFVLKHSNSIWSFVPDDYITKAEACVEAAISAKDVVWLTSVAGIQVVVTAAAAENLFGAASVTNGLATLGGGAGMVGGVFVVVAMPAALTARTLYNLANVMENNSATPTAVAVGGVAGAAGGAVISVVLVADSGVAGLSACGITSGLAALGGGSIAAGGYGMVGGLAVLAGACTLAAATAALAGWGISRAFVQERLRKQRRRLLDIAVKHGFKVLI